MSQVDRSHSVLISRTMMYTRVLIVAVCFISALNAYPEGAPTAACADMVPQHGSTEDTTPCPYETVPDVLEVEQGGTVGLTLQNITNQAYSYRGYLTMAFDASQPDEAGPIGTFVTPSNGQVIDCLTGAQNAITHTNNDNKKKVTAAWTAPADFTGTVVFKTTWVRGGIIFWVKVPSVSVNVVAAKSKNYRQAQRA